MHIIYHQAGGATYARLAESYREGNRVMKRTTNLGKVIDKENGIYQNRDRGIFKFDIATMEYSELSQKQLPDTCIKDIPPREKLILDFGDTYLVDQFLANSGLKFAINAVKCRNADTLYAMLCYSYVPQPTATQHHGLRETMHVSYTRKQGFPAKGSVSSSPRSETRLPTAVSLQST